MRSVTTALDFLLGAAVEILAATLVAAEIIILFSGVVARYALNPVSYTHLTLPTIYSV